MHNNESSKIYHYLRAGLPVVSEAGFPNDHGGAGYFAQLLGSKLDDSRITMMVNSGRKLAGALNTGMRNAKPIFCWPMLSRESRIRASFR